MQESLIFCRFHRLCSLLHQRLRRSRLTRPSHFNFEICCLTHLLNHEIGPCLLNESNSVQTQKSAVKRILIVCGSRSELGRGSVRIDERAQPLAVRRAIIHEPAHATRRNIAQGTIALNEKMRSRSQLKHRNGRSLNTISRKNRANNGHTHGCRRT